MGLTESALDTSQRLNPIHAKLVDRLNSIFRNNGWEFIKDDKGLLLPDQIYHILYQKEDKYLCIGIRTDWPFSRLELNSVPINEIVSLNSDMPGTRWDEERIKEILASENKIFNDAYANNTSFWEKGDKLHDEINEITMTNDERKLRQEKEISLLPEKPTDECPICFNELINEECVAMKCCKRSYHKVCLDKWLKISQICPNCKKSYKGTQRCTTYTKLEGKKDGTKKSKKKKKSQHKKKSHSKKKWSKC